MRAIRAAATARRRLHGSASRRAITQFQMPAMSPTMTEGGIASWKRKEGESFVQGDVLLEIETDKATIDVEAQEDGVMGKILTPDGTKNVPVGKLIALLAEEGDDISNLEIPKEEPTQPPTLPKISPSQKAPSTSDVQPSTAESHSLSIPEHSRPLFPSVHRLLLKHNITDVNKIKGTGVRGMITKGDLLTYLGEASGPLGTFKFSPSPIEEALKKGTITGTPPAAPPKVPLDGPTIRRLIVTSMLQVSQKASNTIPASIKTADFDSIISDYLPNPKPSTPIISSPSTKKEADFFHGLY